MPSNGSSSSNGSMSASAKPTTRTRRARTPQSEAESPSLSPTSTVSTGSEEEDDDVEGLDLNGDEKSKPRQRKPPAQTTRTRKKGQKFQCTGFGNCTLTFTRSEHLSRHIRKHTGEKPYTCFCLREFSRLDNLRQHAYTVHDPREIPHDWEHNAKGRNKARKKEVTAKKARLRNRQTRASATPPVEPATPQPFGQSAQQEIGAANAIASQPAQHIRAQLQPIQPIQQVQQVQQVQNIQMQERPQTARESVSARMSIQRMAPQPNLQPSLEPVDLYQQQPQSPYAEATRYRPHPLNLPISSATTAPQEPAVYHDYRHTTPPHSPSSTPQTPQQPHYAYPSDSTLTTPTSATFHHHRGSFSSGAHTPVSAGWNEPNRRLSMPFNAAVEHLRSPRVLRNPAEMEENRRKRMTWHASTDDDAVNNLIPPLEQARIAEETRPRTRQRASTYLQAPTQMLPSVDALLHLADTGSRALDSTPRTIPTLPNNPGWPGLGAPTHTARRPGRFEHTRSRSASHILHNFDTYPVLQPTPRATYTDTLAEQRGSKRVRAANTDPRASNESTNNTYSTQMPYGRRDSAEVIPQQRIEISNRPLSMAMERTEVTIQTRPIDHGRRPLPPNQRHSIGCFPRPMEPMIGGFHTEFAPERAQEGIYRGTIHANDSGVRFQIPGSAINTSESSRLEEEVFERRPPEHQPLAYLANVCDSLFQEVKNSRTTK